MIRTAAPTERVALEDLQRRASLMWEEYRPYLIANPDAIELPQVQLQEGQVRVLDCDGRIAGFSAMVPRDGWHELDGLFVEPELWGLGIGRALVVDCLATARREGVPAIEVTANPRAEGFYMRLGFVVTGRTETQFGPANRMRISAFPAQS